MRNDRWQMSTHPDDGTTYVDDVVGHKFWDCWWWTYSDSVVDEKQGAAEPTAFGDAGRALGDAPFGSER